MRPQGWTSLYSNLPIRGRTREERPHPTFASEKVNPFRKIYKFFWDLQSTSEISQRQLKKQQKSKEKIFCSLKT